MSMQHSSKGRPSPAWLLALIAAVVGLSGCTGGGMKEPPFAGTFAHGAVAADHEIASQAGKSMLLKGGNAVDAAVATSFTLSVVRPESCGIGGGGFMVIHFSDAGAADQKRRGRDVPRDVALNYREMCPWGVGPDFYEKLTDPAASTHGGKAVGIPGTVAGLLHALDKYGVLDRATVLAPAIRVAEDGFAADKHYVDSARDTIKDFEKNPKWKERFRFVWVRMLREGRVKTGDVMKLPEQAAALRLIADQGAAAFYQGAIGQAMVEAVQRDGGALTHEDLGRFQVSSTEPLKFQALGRTFLTMPPPSSGGVAMAEALGILERIQQREGRPTTSSAAESRSKPFGEDGWRSVFQVRAWLNWPELAPEFAHSVIESFKHAFADRAEWLSDPAFNAVPVAELTSAKYLDARANTFNAAKTLLPDAYGTRAGAARSAQLEDHGTSHFSIVDSAGNAVACTETINLGFGSCLAVDQFGFILNDQLDDFTTRRGKANAFGLKQSDRNLPAPGKRPLSSMTPTIGLDAKGNVEVVAGASGGPRIITGTMQAILCVTMFEAPAWVAVAASRLHHQWSPDVVRMEGELYDRAVRARRDNPDTPTIIEEFQARGHRVERTDDVGNVQLIARDSSGKWQAACDPRKGGKPAGY